MSIEVEVHDGSRQELAKFTLYMKLNALNSMCAHLKLWQMGILSSSTLCLILRKCLILHVLSLVCEIIEQEKIVF